VATGHKGMADRLAGLERHQARLREPGEMADREGQRVGAELLARLREALLAQLLAERPPETLELTVQRILRRERDPGAAVRALLEGAEILVGNTADRPGGRNTVRALGAMLELGQRLQTVGRHGAGAIQAAEPVFDSWMVPLIETVATEHKGIDDLLAALDRHQAHLRETGEIADRERQRVEAELLARLREALLAQLLAERPPETLELTVQRILRRELDPGAAVRALLEGGLSAPDGRD